MQEKLALPLTAAPSSLSAASLYDDLFVFTLRRLHGNYLQKVTVDSHAVI